MATAASPRHLEPSLNLYNLLPSSFANRVRLRRVKVAWSLVVGLLLASLASTAIAKTIANSARQTADEAMVAKAFPLLQLRDQVLRRNRDHRQQRRWIEKLKSQRPDDRMLQTFGAILLANQVDAPGVSQPPQIESISVRMPLRHEENAKSIPEWAVGRIGIVAMTSDREITKVWSQRLAASERIDADSLRVQVIQTQSLDQNHSAAAQSYRVRVSGEPVTEGLLP